MNILLLIADMKQELMTALDHLKNGGVRDGNGVLYLGKDFLQYPEGYLAMEVRIFAEDPKSAARDYDKLLSDVANIEPLFTYNTAVVR